MTKMEILNEIDFDLETTLGDHYINATIEEKVVMIREEFDTWIEEWLEV